MLRRTHLALGIAVALYFLPHIKEGQLLFLGIAIVSSMLPDLESGFAAVKRHHLFSIQSTKQIFHKNRIFHTYTFLLPITILIALYHPRIALPFFLGYSFHLFLDSFSPHGIRPFWPLKHHSHGKIVPGGKIDKVLFAVFLSLDFVLAINFILYT